MMMQVVLSQLRQHIRCQPRGVKLHMVQHYVFPECDLEDLAALQAATAAEIGRRRREHDQLVQSISRKLEQTPK